MNPRTAKRIQIVNRFIAVWERIGEERGTRILEAVEKMDRERALEWLSLFDDYITWPNAESFAGMREKIRSLFELFPNPPKPGMKEGA